MEVQQESKRRRSKVATVSGPLRRSARRLAQQLTENQQSTTISEPSDLHVDTSENQQSTTISELSDLHVDTSENQQSPVVFNLTDAYSAAMDDMPLKDLFPNMKVRKRSQSKKVEASDAPSPMHTGSGSRHLKASDAPSPMDTGSGSKKVEASDAPSPMDTGTGDYARSKLRGSLGVALKISEVSLSEQDQGQSMKVSPMEQDEGQSMKTDSEMVVSDLKEHAMAKQESGLGSDGLAGPDLKDSETKLDLPRMESNPIKEENESQNEIAEAPPKRMKIEANRVKCEDAGQQNEESDKAERVSTPQPTFGLPTIEEAHDTDSNVVAATAVKNQDPDIMAVEGKVVFVESSTIRELNLTIGILGATDIKKIDLAEEKVEELDKVPQQEENSSLPTVLSLDDFVGSKKPKGPKVPVQSDDLDLKLGLTGIKPEPRIAPNEPTSVPSPCGSKDKVPKKVVGSPKRKTLDSGSTKNGTLAQKERKAQRKVNEKLWEGSFRLSGCQISPVLALYKSGDGVELQSWPKLIEIKGRVRLDALEKFLQELRQARTRAVMVVSFRVDEGQTDRGASVTALKEAANYYQRGERVGYAEPVPGYELYLFPGGGRSLKLLVQHGYLSNDQIVSEEEGILIGFVVCRRSTGPTSAAHKSSSSHYYNANRHALSAQLDSPTRPNEVQWTGSVVATRKTTPLPLPVPSKEMDSGNSNSLHQTAYSLTGSASIFLQDQDHKSGKGLEESHRVEDADEDLPPGFGPKAVAMAKRTNVEDDDDDLPEYDFSALNSASISTSVKPPNVVSLSRPALSSQPETPNPYGQLNPSGPLPLLLARPTAPPVHGLLDQVRPLNPVSSQVSQSLNLHAMGLRPPPGPPGGPPPFAIFPPKPHLPADSAFAVRMPSTAPMPAPLPNAGSVVGVHDQRARPLLQGQPVSQGTAQRKEGSKGSSLWDDDDMPEWRPPEVSLVENKQILPRPPAVSNMESGPAGAPSRGTTPPRSGGLQGLPLRPAVPRQVEGRGILQAPSPAMLPTSSSRGPVPIASLEKFATDRGPSTNKPMDGRSFKGGK